MRLLITGLNGAVAPHSDAAEGHSFDVVARALAARFDRPWRVEPNDEYVHDQRLTGSESRMPPLSRRLPALPARAG